MKKFTLSSFLMIQAGLTLAQWTNTGCPTGSLGTYDMAVSGGKLLTVCPKGIFSTTDGSTWNNAFTGITVTSGYTFTQSLKAFGDTLYAGASAPNLYISTDHGDNWTLIPTSSFLFSAKITSIYKNGSVLIFGGDSNAGTRYSTNLGSSWTASTYPSGSDINNSVGYDIVELDGVLYCCSFKNVFQSTDNGINWTQITTAPTIPSSGTSLCKINGGLLLSIYGDGVYRSTDAGGTWTKVLGGPLGTTSNNIARVHYEGGIAFAGGALGQVHYSADNGLTWTDITETGIAGSDVVQSFRLYNGDLYAGSNTSVYRRSFAVSVNEKEKAPSFSVFPNPSSTYVEIQGGGVNTVYRFYDMTSRLVKTAVVNGSGRIDISGMNKGVYILSDGTSSYRLVVE